MEALTKSLLVSRMVGPCDATLCVRFQKYSKFKVSIVSCALAWISTFESVVIRDFNAFGVCGVMRGWDDGCDERMG